MANPAALTQGKPDGRPEPHPRRRGGLRTEGAVPGRDDAPGPETQNDFSTRLAALLPCPRSHLTRYHGVFAPHAKWRSLIVPGKPPAPAAERTPAEARRAMTWAQRLARVFKIDVTRCEYCGGPVRIIASLTDPGVLERTLAARNVAELHGPARGPPQGKLALG